MWELQLNIFASHWRQSIQIPNRMEDVSYDRLLQHTEDLLRSYQGFLAIKATQDLDEQESFAFVIVNE